MRRAGFNLPSQIFVPIHQFTKSRKHVEGSPAARDCLCSGGIKAVNIVLLMSVLNNILFPKRKGVDEQMGELRTADLRDDSLAWLHACVPCMEIKNSYELSLNPPSTPNRLFTYFSTTARTCHLYNSKYEEPNPYSYCDKPTPSP